MSEQPTTETTTQKYVPPNLEERSNDTVEKPKLDYDNTISTTFEEIEMKEQLLSQLIYNMMLLLVQVDHLILLC